jgi:hypothetical protein
MKYFVTFVMIAFLCTGCALTRVGIATITWDFSGPLVNPIVTLNGAYCDVGAAAVGTGPWWYSGAGFLSQKKNGDGRITTANWRSPYPGTTPFVTGSVCSDPDNMKDICIYWDTGWQDAAVRQTIDLQNGGIRKLCWKDPNPGAAWTGTTANDMCGGYVVGKASPFSPYNQVAILKELATHGVLIDDFYHYTLQGSDMQIKVVEVATDRTYNIDLTDQKCGLIFSTDLTKLAFDLNQLPDPAAFWNQVADIADETDGRDLK